MRSAKFETITPDDAARMLAISHGANWRTINRNTVEGFARAMANGDWDVNGEPIILNPDGLVLDGQHRLAALIKANRPLETVVVRGIISDKNIDMGRRRSLNQLLKHFGYKNSTTLAALVRSAYNYHFLDCRDSNVVTGGIAAPNTAFQEWLKDDEERLVYSANQTVAAAGDRLISNSILAFVHYSGTLASSPVIADRFISGLIDGEGMQFNSAPSILRDRLEKERKSFKRTPRYERTYLLISAWNSWIRSEKRQKLMLPRGTAVVLPEFESPSPEFSLTP